MPDKYSFELQCSIDGITWSKTTYCNIIIPAYYYETTWFLIFLSVLFIGIIVGITVLILNRRKEEIKRKIQLNELQLKSIRSKAIPHFSGNTFANIDYFILTDNKENASKYLALLSRLHNMT